MWIENGIVAETERVTRGGTASVSTDAPQWELAVGGGLVVIATPETGAIEGSAAAGKAEVREGRSVAEDTADRKSTN